MRGGVAAPHLMEALGPGRHGALWLATFTPVRVPTGPRRQLLGGMSPRGALYSLAMAKGFSTSILPQSAMITSFRGLSRLSVLVLSTFRTTSFKETGRKGEVG